MDEDLFDTRDSPRTRSMVIAAVQWTKRIMGKVHSECGRWGPAALGSDALRTVKCSQGSLAAAIGAIYGQGLLGKMRRKFS
jgi:hypothetical protein